MVNEHRSALLLAGLPDVGQQHPAHATTQMRDLNARMGMAECELVYNGFNASVDKMDSRGQPCTAVGDGGDTFAPQADGLICHDALYTGNLGKARRSRNPVPA